MEQQTPEDVLKAAEQFVWTFKNLNDHYARNAFKKLQAVMEAVYWPRPSDSASEE